MTQDFLLCSRAQTVFAVTNRDTSIKQPSNLCIIIIKAINVKITLKQIISLNLSIITNEYHPDLLTNSVSIVIIIKLLAKEYHEITRYSSPVIYNLTVLVINSNRTQVQRIDDESY